VLAFTLQSGQFSLFTCLGLVHTTRVQGPCYVGVILDTRVHGPCQRAVNTGSVDRRLRTRPQTRASKMTPALDTRIHGP